MQRSEGEDCKGQTVGVWTLRYPSLGKRREDELERKGFSTWGRRGTARDSERARGLDQQVAGA